MNDAFHWVMLAGGVLLTPVALVGGVFLLNGFLYRIVHLSRRWYVALRTMSLIWVWHLLFCDVLYYGFHLQRFESRKVTSMTQLNSSSLREA